jgi:hypothetical protein
MDARGYAVGGLYFMIWSEDEHEFYLTPEAMIFVGLNIDGREDGVDCWHFQDARSYCTLGAYPDLKNPKKGEDKAKLYVLRVGELDQMVDSARLAILLAEHAARRVGDRGSVAALKFDPLIPANAGTQIP